MNTKTGVGTAPYRSKFAEIVAITIVNRCHFPEATGKAAMILFDTGPLVALCDARNSLHSKALRDLKVLAKARFSTCEPVLVELAFHLSAPSQRIRLQKILEALDVVALPVEDSLILWKQVFEWLDKYRDHTPDWTDGCLAVLCGRDPSYKVWTYDVEFRTTWRRPNGSSIPLAVRGVNPDPPAGPTAIGKAREWSSSGSLR